MEKIYETVGETYSGIADWEDVYYKFYIDKKSHVTLDILQKFFYSALNISNMFIASTLSSVSSHMTPPFTFGYSIPFIPFSQVICHFYHYFKIILVKQDALCYTF